MKRITIALLLLLFTVGVAFRILHFPFRISAVLRVIPADAMVMSRHIAPGERWSTILNDGIIDPWLQFAGMAFEHPGRELARDAGVQWMLDNLGKRYVAMAYVERFAGRPVPAVIASAWVGGWYTHLGRMGFLDNAFPGFRMTRTDSGMRIWQGHFPDLPSAFSYISFGVYEGVAFGVATDQPHGASHLMRVMQRQARSGAEAWLSDLDSGMAGMADLFCVQMPAGDTLYASVSHDGPQRLRMHVMYDYQQTPLASAPVPTTLLEFLAMVMPATAAVAGTTAGTGVQLVEQFASPMVVQDVAQLIFTHAAGRQDAAAVAVWLASRNHGGRMMRLRIPAAGLAMEITHDATVESIVTPILQRLHTRYGQQWQTEPHGQRGVLALTPSSGWYARLPRGERAAVAIWNGFLLLHSSADALDRLLDYFRTNAAADPLQLAKRTSGYIRLDGPDSADVLRVGSSSFALWQTLNGQTRNHAQEAFLQRLSETIEAYAFVEATAEAQDGQSSRGVILLALRDTMEQE